jgi:hypothetical protein
MTLAKYLTVDNVLKTLLAIAIGILLYNVFFKKSEGYYNYQSVDKVSDHAYPMDYENDVATEDEFVPEDYEAVVDPEEEVVEEVYDNSEDAEDEVVDEVVLDDTVDEEMYEYEETEEPYDDSADAEDDEIPDEIYEEADSETDGFPDEDKIVPVNSYDFLYASDVEDGLQENFVLYENTVGEDTNYS